MHILQTPSRAEVALSGAQRELTQATSAHRQAVLALERAESALTNARGRVEATRKEVVAEESKRDAKRDARRAAKRAAKDAAKAAAGGSRSPLAESKTTAAENVVAAGRAAKVPARTREEIEIEEVSSYERCAPASVAGVLETLFAVGTKGTSTDELPLDVLNFLVHADVVIECEAPQGKASGIDDKWYVAFGSSQCVPDPVQEARLDSEEDDTEDDSDGSDDGDDDDLEDIDTEEPSAAAAAKASRRTEREAERAAKREARAGKVAEAEAEAAAAADRQEAAPKESVEEEAVALCIGQKEDGTLCGAVGWYDLGSLPTSLDGALLTAEPLPAPRRAATFADDSWPTCCLMHMALEGYGAGGKPVVPMGRNMIGSAAYHMAACMQQFWLAQVQNDRRMQQNHANFQEREHAHQLLDAAREHIASCAREGAADKTVNAMDLTRSESAVQGLRKTFLRRPWNPRCEKCGVRHEDIEFSTCKFWQAYIV